MEDKILEVIDILGEQFSKLQIKEALQGNKGDVDEAIEYLLREQCKNLCFPLVFVSNLIFVVVEKKPAELFSDKIIASEADRKEAWDGVIQPKLIVPLQNPEDLLHSASVAP